MANKGYEVGTAYVAIVPQTRTLTRELDKAISGSKLADTCAKEGKRAGESLGSKLTGALKGATLAGAGLAAGRTIVNGIKDAIDKYATFEQLEGGVEKIFDQADTAKIFEDASAAYKDLNMSANDYLESITQVGATFAATMGDQAGYDTARKGMLAIADYASGTGRNLDELNEKYALITRSTSSYQSIADQFSGILPATSDAFLEQAQAAGYLSDEYTKLTEVPIEEYQQAVTEMLEKGVTDMGLLGNTAAESTSTISGSLAMTQSAWDNFVTNLGRGNADITESVTQLGESAFAAFSNIGERIPIIVSGVLTALPTLATQASELIVGAASSAIETYGPTIQTWFEELPGNVGTWINSKISELSAAGNDLIGEIVKGLTGDEHATLETFFETLPETVKGWIVGAAETLQDKGREFIAGLLFGATEVGDSELKAKIEGLPGEISGWIGDTLTTLGTAGEGLITGLLDGINAIMPDIVTFFTTFPQNVVTAVGEVGSTLLDKGRELIGGIITGITEKRDGELQTDLSGLPAKALEFIGDTAGTLGAKGREFIQGFMNGVSELVNGDAKTTLGGLLNTLAGFVGSAVQTLWQVGTDFISGLLSGVTDARDGDAQEFFSGLLETLKGFITTGIDVLTFLGEMGTQLISGFLDGVSGGKWTEIKDWFGKIPENLSTAIGEVGDFLNQKGTDFLTGFKTGIEIVGSAIGNWIGKLPSTLVKLIGSLGTKLKQKGTDFLTGFKTGAEKIGSDVGNWIGKLPSTLVKLIGGLTQKLVQKGKDFITGFKTGAENIGSQVGTWINQLPSTLVKLIGSVGTTLLQKGKDLLQGLFDGIKNIFSAPDGVSNFFSNLMETVKGLIPNPVEALVGIGEDVINGFITGIQNISLKPILETIFGTDLANVICDVLGIQSPSRVTKEFGKYTTQGFANGLKDSGAVSSVQNNAKALRGTVTDGIGDTSTLLSGKGKSATQSFANGINDANKTGGVKTNASGLRTYAANGVGDTSGLLTSKGSAATQSFANGVNDPTARKNVMDAAGGVRRDVTDSLSNLNSWSWGYDFIINFKNGLEYASSMLTSAASTTASVMRSIFGHSVPEKGPMSDDDVWGLHFVENFADGITEGKHLLAQSVNDLAKSFADDVDMSFDATVAPRGNWASTQAQPAASGVVITGNTFNVRNDQDIERIAEALNERINMQIAGAIA